MVDVYGLGYPWSIPLNLIYFISDKKKLFWLILISSIDNCDKFPLSPPLLVLDSFCLFFIDFCASIFLLFILAFREFCLSTLTIKIVTSRKNQIISINTPYNNMLTNNIYDLTLPFLISNKGILFNLLSAAFFQYKLMNYFIGKLIQLQFYIHLYTVIAEIWLVIKITPLGTYLFQISYWTTNKEIVNMSGIKAIVPDMFWLILNSSVDNCEKFPLSPPLLVLDTFCLFFIDFCASIFLLFILVFREFCLSTLTVKIVTSRKNQIISINTPYNNMLTNNIYDLTLPFLISNKGILFNLLSVAFIQYKLIN